MRDAPMKVDLVHAFTWTCRPCGASNIEPAVPLPHDIATEIAEEYGGAPDDYEAMPQRVMCKTCRRTFAVRQPTPTE